MGEGKGRSGATGAAAAYWAALQRIGWKSPAPHLVITMDGATLDLREVAPKTVRLWAAGDWAIMAASASTVAEDLNGLTGRRGYGMGLERPTGLSVLLGQLPSARQDR